MRPSNFSRRSSTDSPVCSPVSPVARLKRSFATVMTVVVLATAALPGAALAQEGDGFIDGFFRVWHGTVDVVLLRPMGILRLTFGTVVLMPMSSFVNFVGLPLGQDPKVFQEDWDRLVVEPAEYTFDREIGKDLVGG